MKKAISLILLIVIILTLCTSCTEDEKTYVNYNLSAEPTTLDPQAASDENAKTVIKNIFEGLVRVDTDGTVKAAAAKEYAVSDDGLNYTFKLKSNMKWSNSDALVAEDFAFGIIRALSPDFADNAPGEFLSIINAKEYRNGNVSADELGIYVQDTETLVINLEKAEENFLFALTSICAMPCNKKFFKSTQGQYGTESNTIIGNGPYYVRENYGWRHGEYITLYANEYYNGDTAPMCAGINLSIGKEYENVVDALQQGLTDAAETDTSFGKQAEELGMNTVLYYDAVWGISFNLKDEIFGNKNLRLSLTKSLNIESYFEKLPSDIDRAGEIICPDLKIGGKSYRELAGDVYNNTNLPEEYSFYLKNAFKETGLEKLPEFTIICCDDTVNQQIASDIIEIWNNTYGIYVNKEPLSRNELVSRMESGNYTVALSPIKYTSSSPVNVLCGFTDMPDDVKSKMMTTETSIEGCIEAERYIRDFAVFVPLYYSEKIFIESPQISGVRFYPYGEGVEFVCARKSNKLQ